MNINKVLDKLGLIQVQPENNDIKQAINNVVSNFIEMDNRHLFMEHE
jgi:hypothetical protein